MCSSFTDPGGALLLDFGAALHRILLLLTHNNQGCTESLVSGEAVSSDKSNIAAVSADTWGILPASGPYSVLLPPSLPLARIGRCVSVIPY